MWRHTCALVNSAAHLHSVEVLFTLLPLRPDPAGRCSPNNRRLLDFERNNPALSLESYCCALFAAGLAEFGNPCASAAKPCSTISDLSEDHEELLRILDPRGSYAPEQARVTSDHLGLLLVVTPPRMVYFGVAFALQGVGWLFGRVECYSWLTTFGCTCCIYVGLGQILERGGATVSERPPSPDGLLLHLPELTRKQLRPLELPQSMEQQFMDKVQDSSLAAEKIEVNSPEGWSLKTLGSKQMGIRVKGSTVMYALRTSRNSFSDGHGGRHLGCRVPNNLESPMKLIDPGKSFIYPIC